MNASLFEEMLSGFVEAKKYRAGQKTKLRVSRLAFPPVQMRPTQIRNVRNRLRLSQPEFAEFLCTSIGTVRSWEQGSRSPHSSALRLLAIAKEKPALLLRMAEEPRRQRRKRTRRLVKA
jgi:putative transcriptional regulator